MDTHTTTQRLAASQTGALLLCGWLLAACSATPLERLQGEPEAAKAWTASNRTHPAVDGCQRFVAAARRRDGAAMWAQLSSETKQALSERAKTVGLRGIDLLTLQRLPIEGSLERGKPFEPLKVFAFAALRSLQRVASDDDSRTDLIGQALELTSSDGQKRRIQMRFEGDAWTIHDPTLGGLR
jgi:hypothetical protein